MGEGLDLCACALSLCCGTRMNSKPWHVVIVSGKGLGAHSRFSGVPTPEIKPPARNWIVYLRAKHPSVHIRAPRARSAVSSLCTKPSRRARYFDALNPARIFHDKLLCPATATSLGDSGIFPTTDPERKALASLFFLSFGRPGSQKLARMGKRDALDTRMRSQTLLNSRLIAANH
jgi:hypothetical protein